SSYPDPTNPTANHFAYQILVTSITPETGSKYGGTLLTITGENFSVAPTDNQVFLGLDNVMCHVRTATTTELTCVTGALPADYDPSYETGPVSVVVQGRLIEEATCVPSSACQFTFLTVEGSYPTLTTTQ